MSGEALTLSGIVKSVEGSRIPRVVIAEVDCGKTRIRLDLVKDLLIFKEGDSVDITLSKECPPYRESLDLVMWGYVVSRKKVRQTKGGRVRVRYKVLVSFWGYLMVMETDDERIANTFSIMDRVYLKITTL